LTTWTGRRRLATLADVNPLRLALLVLFAASQGCSVQSADKGGACTRSAQCAEGLACVDGKCSSDLQSIAKGNTVPKLGLGNDAATAAADGGDAGADAARPVQPTGDAAVRDSGHTQHDGGTNMQPAQDAALAHDAAQSGNDAG
jgi:hypothetical protein